MCESSYLQLIFATQNQNKVIEIRDLLPSHIQLKTLKDIGCYDDIPETRSTIRENALQKAQYIYNKYKLDCFADDTGLEIEALNGEPGVYSARYAGEEKNSEKNIDLVLQNLSGEINRTAQFKTVIALIIKGKEFLFEGVVKGNIKYVRYGNYGFGYDSIFEPENSDKTFAQLTLDEKNKYSHRSKAFFMMSAFLDSEKTI